MDFKTIKEKALKLKEKASKQTLKAINYGTKKLINSSLTINTKEELNILIQKSRESVYKNKETGIEKTYKHRSIVIFANEGSEFFKKALYIFPVIITKAFSQNISVKLAKSKIEGVDLTNYKVNLNNLPCLVVFENEKAIKIIEGSENIIKLVKSFDLDINKLIDKA